MTQDEIKTLAKQAGGTAYVSRHWPDKLSTAFGPTALEDFVRLVEEAAEARLKEAAWQAQVDASGEGA